MTGFLLYVVSEQEKHPSFDQSGFQSDVENHIPASPVDKHTCPRPFQQDGGGRKNRREYEQKPQRTCSGLTFWTKHLLFEGLKALFFVLQLLLHTGQVPLQLVHLRHTHTNGIELVSKIMQVLARRERSVRLCLMMLRRKTQNL